MCSPLYKPERRLAIDLSPSASGGLTSSSGGGCSAKNAKSKVGFRFLLEPFRFCTFELQSPVIVGRPPPLDGAFCFSSFPANLGKSSPLRFGDHDRMRWRFSSMALLQPFPPEKLGPTVP